MNDDRDFERGEPAVGEVDDGRGCVIRGLHTVELDQDGPANGLRVLAAEVSVEDPALVQADLLAQLLGLIGVRSPRSVFDHDQR